MKNESLRRLQLRLGLLPLTAMALVHLWEHSPIRHGHSGVLARLFARHEGVPVWLEGALLLAALLVYAGAGAWLVWREPVPRARSERSRQTRIAGLAFVGFLLWHLASLWFPVRAVGGGAVRGLALAQQQLDSLWGAALYVVGWSGLCVLLAYALAGEPEVGVARDGSRRFAPLLGLAFGVALWLWGVDVLAAYVAGAAIF